MNLKDVINSIESKVFEQGTRMTTEEAEILKSNFDNFEARYFYALGLLMNSSCRFHYITGFKGYDEMQLEAFDILQKGIEIDSSMASYFLAEVKCGLFGKFPMYPDEAKKLFEKYCNLVDDKEIKKEILDNWDEFVKERKKRFDDLQLIEVYKSINPQNVDTGGHDEAYYENLSKDNKK